MKKFLKFSLILSVFLFAHSAKAQTVIGLWENVDDEDGKPKSHIEIYEKDGLLYGRVVKLLEGATLKICKKCKKERKDQPIEGMVILWDLEKESDAKWSGGKIIDPKKGKIYGCNVELENENKLKVRGYMKFSAFGRSQYWNRVP